MTAIRTAISSIIQGLAIMAATLFLVCAFAVPAYANISLDAPTTVSDDTTHFSVNKLDADTHEYVSGAKMAIINEETGEVVDSWVTGKAVHTNEKVLDVGVVYILREIEPPEGYSAVDDVRFKVKRTEGEGIEIVSQGEGCELTETYTVSLYDKAKPVENEIVLTKPPVNDNIVVAPKTGDETPLALVAGLVAAGIALILLLQIFKNRMSDENDQG